MKSGYEHQKEIQIFNDDETVCFIIDLVEKSRGHALSELNTKDRSADLLLSRSLIMYLLCKHTKYANAIVGNLFNRDHATALNAKKVISNLIDVDKDFRDITNQLNIEITAFKNIKNTKLSTFRNLIDKSNMNNHEKIYFLQRYLEAN